MTGDGQICWVLLMYKRGRENQVKNSELRLGRANTQACECRNASILFADRTRLLLGCILNAFESRANGKFLCKTQNQVF